MLSSAAKFTSLVPSLSRCLQTAAVARPIPPRRGTRLYYPSVSLRNASADTFDYPVDGYPGAIGSAEDFLKSIGRSAETKVKVEKWDELWKLDGSGLKKQGLDVKDRRYILWAMQNYRLGADPTEFAHPATPKKKIRGWGPSVQNGKRIRSRRHR